MIMDDEFARIDWLAQRFGWDRSDPSTRSVPLGIGDDAAILDFDGRAAVVTVDTQVEDVHFRRRMLSEAELGARAIITAASDVWAMGTTPTAAVVAMALPSDFGDAAFRSLIDGIDDASRELELQIVGGNLSAASLLSLTTTVLGPAPRRVLTRAGAQVGDAIYVTGTLGAAALGLSILERSAAAPHAEAFAARWRRPPSHRAAITDFASIATAAIDLSDGLLQDLSHVCRASGVGAEVFADALPMATGYRETCRSLGLDALELSLTGGEDYEILFTAPVGSAPDGIATAIGSMQASQGIVVVDATGAPLELSRVGYRHFS